MLRPGLPVRRLGVAAALALGALGCEPVLPEGAFVCAQDSDCPEGWFCVIDRCRSTREDAAMSVEPQPPPGMEPISRPPEPKEPVDGGTMDAQVQPPAIGPDGSPVPVEPGDSGGPPVDVGPPADVGPLADGSAPAPDARTETDPCADSDCALEYPCRALDDAHAYCLGQLAMWPMPNHSEGLPNQASYVADEAVLLDQITGLTWQQAGSPTPLAWADARQYCEGLGLQGRTWRLPSYIELASIVDVTREPQIDPLFAPTALADYWTTSPVTPGPEGTAWAIPFNAGRGYQKAVESEGWARCVSGEPVSGSQGPVAGRYEVSASGGVLVDTRTGLAWERAFRNQTLNAASAETYCSELSLEGRDNWRVPSLAEVLTTVDPTQAAPAFEPTGFALDPVSDGWLWTAENLTGSSLVLAVRINSGATGKLNGTSTSDRYVRCVSAR